MESVRIRLWHNEDASFLLHSIWVLSWKDVQDSFLITSLWARLVDLLDWMNWSEYLPVTSPCHLCLSERVIWVLSRSVQVGGFQRSSLPGEACGRWMAFTTYLCKSHSFHSSVGYRLKQNKRDGVAQRLKNLPAMQETWVQSLGQEEPLEKEMATHCNILAWKVPWTEEPGGLQSTGSQRVGHDWVTQLNWTDGC